MTITQERIAELRELLGRSYQSPLPWRVKIYRVADQVEYDNGQVASFEIEEDADLAVQAVNSLPSLLDAAEQSLRLEEAMDWFGSQRTLELYFYQPVYGDDDDQAREWRVDQVGGSINDHERTTVGRGSTPIEAIASARAALGGSNG